MDHLLTKQKDPFWDQKSNVKFSKSKGMNSLSSLKDICLGY